MGKKSTNTTSKTVYGNTTTTNPFVTSQTTNNGTISEFKPNTAFNTINSYVNKNIGGLLDEYLNPTLNSTTNKAKMDAFINNINAQSSKSLENNIINPLSQKNMIRSSQATNLYKNLAENNANQIGSYTKELLSTSQQDTAKLLNNLMLLYLNGYNAISENQKQSLLTSQGNSSKTENSTDPNAFNSEMAQIALQLVMASME